MSVHRPLILIVDDDPTMREFMRWCLAPLRPELLEARDGVEALKALRGYAPHLVISDVQMPNMDGFDLVAAAQKDPALSRIPFLMMSSMEERSAYRRAFGLGVCDYIVKPLAREDVLATVRRVLDVQSAPKQAKSFCVPGYELIKVLGEGATGQVHLARRTSDGRECALKLMSLPSGDTESHETVSRFLDEARLLASIRHAHVAQILDHGVTDSCLYLAMEYFPGGDLRKSIKERPSAGRALKLARQIGEGLAAVHAAGIVHRDLKPGNIMVRGDGSVAIADFGLAKQLDALITRTREGMAMGTPLYMSPEQINGERLDGRADLYSLGVLMYEWLAGRPLFEAGSIDGLLVQHLHAERPLLPEHSVVAVLQPLLDKLIARYPGDRFKDAHAFLAMLRQASEIRFEDVNAIGIASPMPNWVIESVPAFLASPARSVALPA